MNYWLDLFTGKTWQEFLDSGAEISGFRESRWTTVQKIAKGDYMLCYSIQLDFLMLPTVEHSLRRVARRVLSGGHNVPDADVRRRFSVSLRNLFTIYRPVLDYWRLHAASVGRPRLIAHGSATALTVEDKPAFANIVTDFNLPL